MFNPVGLYHPFYNNNSLAWQKYRRAWESGDQFVLHYLKSYTERESNVDFHQRRDMTPCPGLVRAAIQQLRNSIYSKMKHVIRDGGSRSWLSSCLGIDGGIDLQGSTMNSFMGINILEELMVMGRVGIYVDMPQIALKYPSRDDYTHGVPGAAPNLGLDRPDGGFEGNRDGYGLPLDRVGNRYVGYGTTSNEETSYISGAYARGDELDTSISSQRSLAAVAGKRPYCYIYQAEQIRSWRWWQNGPKSEFQSLLLIDNVDVCDDYSGLPNGVTERYRHYEVRQTDRGPRVFVTFYNHVGDPCNYAGIETHDVLPIELGISRIPFILLDLPMSLLADAVTFQIAIMNMNSSDIGFAFYSNFPLYTEPYDPRSESPFIARIGEAGEFDAPIEEVEIGPQIGKRYPFGQNAPAFINPSPEPMRVSMEKQEQLKNELRSLIHMNVASLSEDQPSIDNGLGYLAGMLQIAETRIVEYWGMYEGIDVDEVTIAYPQNFVFADYKQIQEEVKQDIDLAGKVTSPTLRRELMKKVVAVKVGNTVSPRTIQEIQEEIDENEIQVVDAAALAADIEAGVVSLTTASKLRGYPDGDVEIAKVDHAERLARIQASQAPTVNDPPPASGGKARGIPAKDGDQKSGKTEKQLAKDNQPKDAQGGGDPNNK